MNRPVSPVIERARVVLVAGLLDGSERAGEPPLEELARLVDTAGGSEVARTTQRLSRPSPGTFVGSGKVDEIAGLVARHRADVVVFDNDLSPAQERNLEKRIGCGVISRSELILGIFARRARTRQAKLQVELARLEYMLPRLRRLWTHLERQKGGIGLRAGAGERQIETDRRKIKRRILEVRSEIDEIQARRRRAVETRAAHFTVSLVGYTNAGKSTLMRALTGVDVLVEDRLFSTLDTKTGALAPDRAGGVEPPAGLKILVSDTVGFIRDLPHNLVASFHATLEEARSADLLLHVVDVSHPCFEEQMSVVERVLDEIGAGGVRTLVVLNKIDRLRAQQDSPSPASAASAACSPRVGPEALGVLAEKYGDAVAVSALTGEGVDRLRTRIVELAASGAQDVRLALLASQGEAMRFLFNHAFNLRRKYLDDGSVEVTAALRPGDLARLLAIDGGVRVLERVAERPATGGAAQALL